MVPGSGAPLRVEAGAPHGPRLAVERRRARERLGHGERQAPHVGPRPGLAPGLGDPLFRRSVGGGERRHLVLGDGAARHPAHGLRRRALGLGDPEVEDLHRLGAADAGDEEVLGLEVAVDDGDRALGPGEAVGLGQRGGDGAEHLDHLVQPERGLALLAAVGDDPVERLALEPLEREEGHEPPVPELEHVDVEGPAHSAMAAESRNISSASSRNFSRKTSRCSPLIVSGTLRHLSATGARKPPCRARYTTANPPSATTCSTRNCPPGWSPRCRRRLPPPCASP